MYLPHGYDDFNGLMDMYMPSFNGIVLGADSSGRNGGGIGNGMTG